MNKRVVGSVAVLVVVLMLGGWVVMRGSRPPPARDLAARFVGFSNATSGSAAVFLITNSTRYSQHFQIASVERRLADGRWDGGLPKPGQGLIGMLDPRQGLAWPIAVDSTNDMWRIRLSCQEHRTGVTGAVDKAKEFSGKIRGTDTRILLGRQYEVLSSE